MAYSDNPFLDRAAKKGKSGHGKLAEQKGAKSIGARLQPNSGAMRGAKSDMRADLRAKLQIEHKSTVNTTLPLEQGWLTKILTEALNVGRVPALMLAFVTPEGDVKRPPGTWIMITKEDFDTLMEE